MIEKTVELDVPLLLPEIEDRHDHCLENLQSTLIHHKGIYRAHIKEGQPPRLCSHYDPNLISLAAVERIARDTGNAFTHRYRHERIPFNTPLSADAADLLNRSLEKLPGMLHASVNAAAGLAFVAYDTELLDRKTIETLMQQQGYASTFAEKEEEHDHDHGSAPAFLPHALQEIWTYALVALAGICFLIGWIGETFLGLGETTALAFYLVAYLAGGYDIATHAIPGLLRGKFDTDILMLAAAAGAALLGEWAEGAFLLFLFSLGHAGEHSCR